MSTNKFANMFNLEDDEFIGGTSYTIEFTVTDIAGVPVDLSASTCSWTMGYFGNPEETVLSKTGVISGVDNEIFTITLESSDTSNIYGKFIQQPVIIDFSGREFRLGQGILTIIPNIPVI